VQHLDERQISRQPGASFPQSRGRSMKHDAHLDALCFILQTQNSEDRFVKGAARLDHVIMDAEGEFAVEFDGREVIYGFTELDELVLSNGTEH
jgi:hypothetical protein